jgi:hypothetical protein
MLNPLKFVKIAIFWDVMQYCMIETEIWKELVAFSSRWTAPHPIPP